MSTLFNFTVSGRGEFPYDMLRYDECYPRTTEDAMRIPYPTDQYSAQVRLHDSQRKIRFQSAKMPAVDRWASFGWNVTEFMGCRVIRELP